MRKISIKTIISILCSKFTLFLTKTILKGGTTFPGRVALKIDKNILSKVSKGYKVILVTGTNGKTTTTSMIYNIIKESGHPVITNNTGANLFPGIVTTFVDNFKFGSKVKDNYAVIEVDEANLKYLAPFVLSVPLSAACAALLAVLLTPFLIRLASFPDEAGPN